MPYLTKKYLTLTLFACLNTLLLTQCIKIDNTKPNPKTNDFDASVIVQWIDLTNTLTQTTNGYTLPVATRAYAYMGIAAYESVASGMPQNQSMQGQLQGLNNLPSIDYNLTYHFGIIANECLAQMAKALFENAQTIHFLKIDSLKNKINADLNTKLKDENTANRSKLFGNAMGKALVVWLNTDGAATPWSNNYPNTYTPPLGEGLWKPTSNSQTRALQPFWGTQTRSFLAANANINASQTPIAYSANNISPFYVQAFETYAIGKTLTSVQLTTAKYWANEPTQTPTLAGHFATIARNLMADKNEKLGNASELFAKIGIGMHDATLAAWKNKFLYNVLRPQTYIQEKIDPTWLSALPAQPTPDYVSENACLAAAAAMALSDTYGYTTKFIDKTHAARTDFDGSPRTYNAYTEAAAECALASLYAGTNYRFSNDNGLNEGYRVARNILNLKWKK